MPDELPAAAPTGGLMASALNARAGFRVPIHGEMPPDLRNEIPGALVMTALRAADHAVPTALSGQVFPSLAVWKMAAKLLDVHSFLPVAAFDQQESPGGCSSPWQGLSTRVTYPRPPFAG